jgi:DNA-binding transcriptional LysR family regulator
VRIAIPKDFAAYRLTELLSDFARSRPGLRLDVRCGVSVNARRALERGELDIALFKRDAGEGGGTAAWPERLHWVTSRKHPIDFRRDPLPIVRLPSRSASGLAFSPRLPNAVRERCGG